MNNKDCIIVFSKVSKNDVKINNSLIGTKHMALFNYNNNKFVVAFAKPFNALKQKLQFVFNIGNNDDVVVSFNNAIQLSNFDNRFSNIDLALIEDEEIRTKLASCAIKNLIDNLSVVLNSQVSLKTFTYDIIEHSFTKEIGIEMFNITTGEIFYGNISSGDHIFNKIIEIINKIDPLQNKNYNELLVNFSIEIGRTDLSRESFVNLKRNNIIFLDKKANFNNSEYSLNGLSPIKVNCNFANNKLSVINVK